MNITDALKTGRRIRRAHWEEFHLPTANNYTSEEILADDWEVQPEIVEISREEYFKSVSEWAKSEYTKTAVWMNKDQFVEYILRGTANLWEEFKKQGKIK